VERDPGHTAPGANKKDKTMKIEKFDKPTWTAVPS